MSCCIERAILDALRSLTCTPIKSENHFIDQRECENCVPYLVLKASSQAGLRTSSFTQKIWTIDIKAYFADSKKQMVRDFRDLVEDWLYAGADLGVCGSFCVTGSPASSIRPVSGSEIVYSLVFRGSYSQVDSESLSASV
jgi:hypothetical protein